MSSENAKQVARDVIKALGKSDKVVLGKIVERRGYSKSTIKHPKRVTDTDSYKETITPFVERLQKEIERIHSELEIRDLGDEKYKDLVDSLDKLNKQVQLATGGETERVKLTIQISESIAKKNDLNTESEPNS